MRKGKYEPFTLIVQGYTLASGEHLFTRSDGCWASSGLSLHQL